MLRRILSALQAEVDRWRHPTQGVPPMPTSIDWDENEYVAAQQRAPQCYACAKPKPRGQIHCDRCIAVRTRLAS